MAQTLGPVLAGRLVKVISAPLAILVDAVSYLVSALVLTRLGTAEPVSRPETRHLGRELRDGLAWVYRHRMLAPLALTSHVWFLCTSMIGVVYPYFVLDELGFDAFALGLTFALAGVGGLVGASLSGWVVRRFGPGPAMAAGRLLTPAAFVLVPFAAPGPTGLVLLGGAQLLFGLSIGLDGSAELGFRQAVTPDRLRAG